MVQYSEVDFDIDVRDNLPGADFYRRGEVGVRQVITAQKLGKIPKLILLAPSHDNPLIYAFPI